LVLLVLRVLKAQPVLMALPVLRVLKAQLALEVLKVLKAQLVAQQAVLVAQQVVLVAQQAVLVAQQVALAAQQAVLAVARPQATVQSGATRTSLVLMVVIMTSKVFRGKPIIFLVTKTSSLMLPSRVEMALPLWARSEPLWAKIKLK
jgi:hypothetical protein